MGIERHSFDIAPPRLTVGLDARAAAEDRAGRGRVTRELIAHLRGLDYDVHLVLYSRSRAPVGVTGKGCTPVLLRPPPPLWHALVGRDASRRCDVFLSTNSYITPLFLRIPTAIMVYDLVAFAAFDVAHRRARVNERITLGAALRRAAGVICISEATRAELVERFPAAAPKATVVPLAAGQPFGRELSPSAVAAVRARYGVEGPFVLALGTLEPRKNLPRLIEAFAALPPGLRDTHQLVLAGAAGWGMGRTRHAIERHDSMVRALGWVPDEDLAALYQACEAFCYPSLHEGFGLPVLEAMRSGAVVVAAGVPSLREVGGDAAIYVDPQDTAGIRAGLEAALDPGGRPPEIGRRARERAAEFSWEDAARAVLRELERCRDRAD
jgi:glycosyltransferase involved in cell wall biosynthesis